MQALTDSIYCVPQVTEADIAQAAQQGVKTVICTRPDHEDPDQPTFAQVKKWCEAHGLHAHHVPVTPGQFNDDAAVAFAQASQQTPVLAYCRSGLRAAVLWGAGEIRAKKMTPQQVLAAIAQTGRDASGALAFFEQQARA